MAQHKIDEKVRSTLCRLYTDAIPTTCLWDKVAVWHHGSGPLTAIRNQFWTMLKHIRHPGVGRDIEKAYFEMKPRNVKLGSVIKAKVESVNLSPINGEMPPLDFLIKYFKSIGLGKTKADLSERNFYRVKPPRNQASTGVTYLPDTGRVVYGKKGDYFSYIQESIPWLFSLIEELDLRFDDLWKCTAQIREVICKVMNIVYLFFLRIDTGGPQKPRLIWPGHCLVFMFEQVMFICFGIDARASCHFAYTASQIWRYLDLFPEMMKIMLDVMEFDLSFGYHKIVRYWMAMAKIYDIPEALAAFLAACNVLGILLYPDGSKRYVFGIQKSGTGAFAYINHLLGQGECAWAQYRMGEAVLPGLNLADNILWPTSLSVRDWSNQLRLQNLKVKTSETMLGRDSVVMLRKVFNVSQRTIEPVVLSRLRNALCPTSPDPFTVPNELRAIVSRAQSLELIMLAREDKRYKPVLDKWFSSVISKERFMGHLSDRELMRALPKWAFPHTEGLTWTKRFYGLVDVDWKDLQ
jgi:hypothetical protein